jgi:hypothetical protein
MRQLRNHTIHPTDVFYSTRQWQHNTQWEANKWLNGSRDLSRDEPHSQRNKCGDDSVEISAGQEQTVIVERANCCKTFPVLEIFNRLSLTTSVV